LSFSLFTIFKKKIFYSSGPSELLVLVKENAGKSWQEIVGPEEPAKASEISPTRFVNKTIYLS